MILSDGNVQVEFDEPNTRGRRNIGIYDPYWFILHPNGLIHTTNIRSTT